MKIFTGKIFAGKIFTGKIFAGKIFAVMLLLAVILAPAASRAKTEFTISFQGPNSYLFIAGCGAVAAGVTFGIFRAYYRSGKESETNTMYASLFTYDMQKGARHFDLPDISVTEKDVSVPLVHLKF